MGIEMMSLRVIKLSDTGSLKFDDPEKDFNLHKSVEKYGQLRPLIINQDNVLVDGHRLLVALKRAEYTEAMVLKIETNTVEAAKCEINGLVYEEDPIKFIKALKEVDPENNCLPLKRAEINYYLELLDFDWKVYDRKKVKGSLFEDILLEEMGAKA